MSKVWLCGIGIAAATMLNLWLIAAPGCITDREGTRQSAYHYVFCACRCSQFPRDPRRYICLGCGHLGEDLPLDNFLSRTTCKYSSL